MINSRTSLHFVVVLALLRCNASFGQELTAQLAVGEQPYFAGLPVPLQITVSGVEDTPTPSWKLAKELPDGVSLTLASVSPQVSRRTIISNGRTLVNESNTKFVFQFRLTSERSGPVSIGAVEFEQNGNTTSVEVPVFSFREITIDEDMIVEMQLPESPLYVGQRVLVSITWGYAGDVSRVRNLRFASSFFDRFEFQDEEVNRNDTFALFTSHAGDVNVRADQTQQRRDGRNYEILTFTRTLVATQAGTFEFDHIAANIDYVTRYRRILGGVRQAVEAIPRRGKSEAFQVEVLPLPKNAPSSFAGAIGSGFRLDVDVLGSTIVNVGDPIKLRLTVTGNGNIDEIGLPPLIGDSAFDPKAFRVAEGQLAGKIKNNSKEFVTQIRVDDDSVNLIPPIAYSWFDPTVGEYKTAHSEPRSITVGKAERISSADVVAAKKRNGGVEQVNELPQKPSSGDSPSELNLAGADLSISIDANRLSAPAATHGNTFTIAIYACGVALLGLTALVRSRKRQSVATKDSRLGAVRMASDRVELSAREGDLTSLVSSLRGLLPFAESETRSDVEQLLADLEQQIYSPTDARGEVDEGIASRAVDLAAAVSKSH